MNKMFPLTGDVLLLVKQMIEERCCGQLLRFQRTDKKQRYEAVCREMNWKLFFTQNEQKKSLFPLTLTNDDIMIALIDTGNPKQLQLLIFSCIEWAEFQAGHTVNTGPLDFPFPGQAAFAPYIYATTLEIMDINNPGYPRTLSEGEQILFNVQESVLVVYEQITDMEDDWSPKKWELLFFENSEQADFLIDRYGYKLDLNQKNAVILTEYQWDNHFLASSRYREGGREILELGWGGVNMELQTENFSSLLNMGKRAIEIMNFFKTTSFVNDIPNGEFTFKMEKFEEHFNMASLPEEPE